MKQSIPAKSAMTANVVTVSSNETVVKAAEIMTKKGIGSLIITEGEKPVGIITERDLLEKIVSSDLKASEVQVSEIMSKPLTNIEPDTDLFDAIQIMVRNDIRRLPVVEDEKLIGILSADDVVEVSPKILEIIPEREGIETTEEVMEESVCEVCGEARKSLHQYNERWICDECRDFLKR